MQDVKMRTDSEYSIFDETFDRFFDQWRGAP